MCDTQIPNHSFWHTKVGEILGPVCGPAAVSLAALGASSGAASPALVIFLVIAGTAATSFLATQIRRKS